MYYRNPLVVPTSILFISPNSYKLHTFSKLCLSISFIIITDFLLYFLNVLFLSLLITYKHTHFFYILTITSKKNLLFLFIRQISSNFLANIFSSNNISSICLSCHFFIVFLQKKYELWRNILQCYWKKLSMSWLSYPE